MKKINWIRIIFIIGVIGLIAGALDPLEGSVVISGGIILITLASYLSQDPQRKAFLVSMILILTGVILLFYLSSLGGFGGTSELSWWWGVLILPYPAGWILAIVSLIKRISSPGQKSIPSSGSE